MLSREDLLAFDHSGKFLYPIGRKGQGPGEYLRTIDIFTNTDKSTIFISDARKMLEYDFHGTFIKSFPNPNIDNRRVTQCAYVGEDVFVGQFNNKGKYIHKYCLFDRNGDTVKCFPNYFLLDMTYFPQYTSLNPIRTDDCIYLKDYVNDTVYNLVNRDLRPAYIFGLGKPQENIESLASMHIYIMSMIGTPDHFFYCMHIPESFPRPKSKKVFDVLSKEFVSWDAPVYGIYNISANTNILLDTDNDLQRGIINDINGGLPIFPRYYAGKNVVVDIWYPEEMKEMLTDEYFEKQTIKDKEGHNKLKALLKNLKEDDNPVVVVAKLK